jgi:molybdate transport system ATP-binding protein
MHESGLVCLRDATFRLGEQLVFPNTTWTWRRHEHWAVLGPNGSGKSLLADALRGRVPLVHGELRYGFRPPPGLEPEAAIGHVSFEERRLDLHETVVQSRWNSIEEEGALSARDFLSYERVMDINPFEVVPRPDRARRQFARRLHRAITLLEVAPLLDHALLTLSNGERQRVQLARALCHPLRLLILDEPFLGLDIAARAHFHQVLEHLMGAGLGVLLLTTRPEDLPRHITHVLHLKNCEIVAQEPRRQLQLFGSRTLRSRRPATPPQRRTTHLADQRNSRARLALAAPLIQLREVHVSYGKAAILRNIHWTIHQGENWALLGPNGSGKSTLLGLLSGDHPQAYVNDVSVFGRRRGQGESIWELKQQIGSVSPELQLHFDGEANCFEVVASGFFETIGLFEPPTRRQRAAVREWLARFQILDLARTPFTALSAGVQRTVLLARALVKKPRLLLLDEPCQGLDRAHRDQFLKIIDGLLRERAVTAIYVTHRADEIPGSIRRVFQLTKGRGIVRARTPPKRCTKP